MLVDNERPPIATFKREAVEDRAASIAAGRYIAKDVDFVTVTRPGARDNFVTVATEYAESLHQRARQGLIPADWPEKFDSAYARWLKGEDLPESGTPIKGWGLLSPATQEMLLHAGIRTVEDLAGLPDGDLSRLGMGMHHYREKAKAFLETASSTGAIVEEIANLKTQLADAVAMIEKLSAENKSLSSKVIARSEKDFAEL